MNTAVPGTRVAPPSVRLWMNGARSIASCDNLACNSSRPRFQVDNNVKISRPKTSGNQPPAGIFTALAEKSMMSISTNGTAQASASRRDHFHSRLTTTNATRFVINIVPVTAMPYAAARLLDDLKPTTSATTVSSNIQLIAGM